MTFYQYEVELQWLDNLWNHENMFETGVVRANECYLWNHENMSETGVVRANEC